MRSEKYRRWVSTLACMGCGIEGQTQVAHSNQAKHGKGMSIKASDLFTFPLCAPHWGRPGCHFEHDMAIGMSKATRDALEDEYIARTHDLARQAGRPEMKEAA
jgi:hypothetical protein